MNAESVDPLATELARFQWDEGRRALARAGADRGALGELRRQVDLVEAELSRRVGQVFGLGELVAVYADADRWAPGLLQEALADAALGHTSIAVDAAFELYSRRAFDYEP